MSGYGAVRNNIAWVRKPVYSGQLLQPKTHKASQSGMQPGVRNILWLPRTTRADTASVNIQNYATAAFIPLIPYQPNAAALANSMGVGDGCSSHGNRNLVYYNNWFIRPQRPASDPSDAFL
jgi:hypothetical protein